MAYNYIMIIIQAFRQSVKIKYISVVKYEWEYLLYFITKIFSD